MQEAVRALGSVRRTSPYVVRSLAILNAIQSAEQAQWDRRRNRGNDVSHPLKRRRSEQTNVLNLALRIKEAVENNAPEVIEAAQTQQTSDCAANAADALNLISGRAPGQSAEAKARAAGLPPAAEFPYLIGPHPGEAPLDLPAVGPNGTALSSGSGAIGSPAPSALPGGLTGQPFDLPTFVAAYQTALEGDEQQVPSDASSHDVLTSSSTSQLGISSSWGKCPSQPSCHNSCPKTRRGHQRRTRFPTLQQSTNRRSPLWDQVGNLRRWVWIHSSNGLSAKTAPGPLVALLQPWWAH